MHSQTQPKSADRGPIRRGVLTLTCAQLILAVAGCSLLPSGIDAERSRLAEAGAVYHRPIGQRSAAELPPHPDWKDILSRALLVNGELESAFHEWQAALERVPAVSGYPNTNLSLGYANLFFRERVKGFDRRTLSGSFDSMENLSFPVKVRKSGEIALSSAREAAERFRALKFDIQTRVLSAWSDYAMLGQKLKIERDRLALSRAWTGVAKAKTVAGSGVSDLLKAKLEEEKALDSVKSIQSQIAISRANLNGMLGRAPEALLDPPENPPVIRAIPVDDAQLLALGTELNPELGALSERVRGRGQALELARLQWIPDINPLYASTAGVGQAIGAAVVLPTTMAEIRGNIRAADAELKGSEAALWQARHDRTSKFVATLVALRDSERQARLFESSIVPAAIAILSRTRDSYIAGGSSFWEMLEAARSLYDAQLVWATARTEREKRLLEFEALAGVDIETLRNDGASV